MSVQTRRMAPCRRRFAAAASALATVLLACTAAAATGPDYNDVDALFAKRCLDCHSTRDPDGKLVLESHATLLKGGESGPSILPGRSGDSILIQAVEGRWEKEGKKRIMPPGKRPKLEPGEIALLRAWIDAGALPSPAPKARELKLAKVAPTTPPRESIQSLAVSPDGTLLAVARYGRVEVRSASTRRTQRELTGHQGNVNSVAFSQDGRWIVSAAGQPGQSGELRIWSVTDGTLKRTLTGHGDAIYCATFSPDGMLVASGSYDQEIRLWNVESGATVQALHGHNGAVFDVAFRPDGRVLASASGDRTVKLWDVTTGKRLDTLSQSTRELYTLAWSSSGGRLFAGGVDNRIRVWRISPDAAETTNPLLESRFAHDGALLNLVLSADGKLLASSAEDGRIKLWDASKLTEAVALPSQPDLSPGLAFTRDGKQLLAGRLDGSLESYDTTTGKSQPPARPELTSLEPRGVRRGGESSLRLHGKGLAGLVSVRFNHAGIQSTPAAAGPDGTLEVRITPAASLPRGMYQVSVDSEAGPSNTLGLWIDELPQVQEKAESELQTLAETPATAWGVLEKAGDQDVWELAAKAGDTLVIDIASKAIGSKLNPRLELIGPGGSLAASGTSFDGAEPLLVHRVTETGRHRIRVQDDTLRGSPDHTYRLTLGVLPYVVSVYPPAVPVGTPQAVTLIGYNLPSNAVVTVRATTAGETEVPLDAERFWSRGGFKVLASELEPQLEMEPNNLVSEARLVKVPAVVVGRIQDERGAGGDVDCHAFHARAGQRLILETEAARRGSPADTAIEILTHDGRPVPRALLQAVRNTAINFRSVDANNSGMRLDHYEEMELNEMLYMNGDLMKLFRMPQGPDSDMTMYTKGGKRRAFLDTTATAHSLDETGFIVNVLPAGAMPVNNGLPSFTLNHSNDDDGDRRLGSDSRLFFTAPADGDYRVRVRDAIGGSSPRHHYLLRIREPHPGFVVTLEGANPTLSPGSGQTFTLRADRMDGFEGPIEVTLTGLPQGFRASSPVVIEAGHDSASGVIFADADARAPAEGHEGAIQVTARTEIEGRLLAMSVNPLGTLRLATSRPRLQVLLEPASGKGAPAATEGRDLQEIAIEPGQTVTARLAVVRNGHEDVITFGVDNLPHGVIVDNLGLNGITFLKGENEREIFLTAAKWVQPGVSLFHAVENQAGRQASKPLLLRIRPAPAQASAH